VVRLREDVSVKVLEGKVPFDGIRLVISREGVPRLDFFHEGKVVWEVTPDRPLLSSETLDVSGVSGSIPVTISPN
jgi:hypothetical protein